MATRKTPQRTCVACRRQGDKRDFVRFVRSADGETHVDLSGKSSGRGASVCADQACFEAAASKKRLAPALRASLTEEDIERLRYEFEEALRARSIADSPTGR
ncbi:MAG: YlxR family protein [Actinobacteria bacterium]|nr:YlxR family protein [Actinomycetota bacterium]